jgi:hypothetical protein
VRWNREGEALPTHSRDGGCDRLSARATSSSAAVWFETLRRLFEPLPPTSCSSARRRARPTVARTRRPLGALESRGRGASDAPLGRRLRPTVGEPDDMTGRHDGTRAPAIPEIRAEPPVDRSRSPLGALESRGRGASEAPQGQRLRPTVGAPDFVDRGRVRPSKVRKFSESHRPPRPSRALVSTARDVPPRDDGPRSRGARVVSRGRREKLGKNNTSPTFQAHRR